MSGKVVELAAVKTAMNPSAAKPVVRGPHAERTATMRQRLIDAAITCLHACGYAATTTQLVVETAGVSRGAILHHFPTKVDLMLAVAEFAAAQQHRYIRQRLAEVEQGVSRYIAMTAAAWEVISQPPALALIEIMMAARSDEALAERLRPVVSALEARHRQGVVDMAAELGIHDRETVEAMAGLHLSAMRGVAVDLNWSGDKEQAERSVRLLDRYKRFLTGELLTARDNAGDKTS